MRSSIREDILETLYKEKVTGNSAVPIGSLAILLDRDAPELGEILREMERDGDLRLSPEMTITLTPRGEETGGKTMRKHRILECFFSEMLGMAPETAGKEACTLEHSVSDEAIERLGNYIRAPGGAGPRGMRRAKRWQVMTLIEGAEGDTLVISCVRCRGPGSRLHDLGLFPGTPVEVVRKIPGNGIVIRVKESDIALSPEIAASIIVERPG
ncbi:MAG: metal-dependent transcriptional regulator [Methanomicrobiales archaeon]|nr:metal-dependent transcriptional regulator [Methanomicrobiales archaeon]NYT21204.1 metal-dependent transcriptional regulator [Methanomicrobiales archaeon]